MLNIYKIYMEDTTTGDCFAVHVPAKNQKAAESYVEGNGEIIKVKDVTDDAPICVNRVAEALQVAHFGQVEIDIITRALSFTLKNTI